MADTGIQWTDKVWNPTTGCSRISPGCKNCYAFQLHDMRHAAYQAGKNLPMQYAKPFKELQLFEDRLDDPLRWRTPKKVFVNSMSDLFHKDIPDEFIDAVFGTMGACEDQGRGHVFQILTKRADRMLAYNRTRAYKAWNAPRIDTEAWPARNVWWGVSVEDRKHGLPRIDRLRQVSAAVRFLSIEPLLEDLGTIDLTGIHWVIVGGESGKGARVCETLWIRRVMQQCKTAGVPVFVKQLGSRAMSWGTDDGTFADWNFYESIGRHQMPDCWYLPLKHNHGGNTDEWAADLRVREFPEVIHA